MTQRQDQAAALGVITKDRRIRAWLEANDPKALAQCEKALLPLCEDVTCFDGKTPCPGATNCQSPAASICDLPMPAKPPINNLVLLLNDARDRLIEYIGTECECDNTHEANNTKCCLCQYKEAIEGTPYQPAHTAQPVQYSPNMTGLLETAVAISEIFHRDIRYQAFYDQYGEQLSGFPGIWMYLVEAAIAFEKETGPVTWVDGYIEAIGEYVDLLLATRPDVVLANSDATLRQLAKQVVDKHRAELQPNAAMEG